MGDCSDADGGLGRAVAGKVARELGVGPFHHIGLGIETEIALDHDLRRCRDVEIDRFTFHQLDRRIANGAHHVVLADPLGHG